MSEIGQCWDELRKQAARATDALEKKQTQVGDALQRLLDEETELKRGWVASLPREGDTEATAEFRTRLGTALSSIHEALSVCLGQAIGQVTHSRLTRRYEGVHFGPVLRSAHELSAVVGQVSEQVSKIFDTLCSRSTAQEFEAELKAADSAAEKVAFDWLTLSLESAVDDESEREEVISAVRAWNIWDTAVEGARRRWDVMQGNVSASSSDFWAYMIWNDVPEPRLDKGKEVYRGPPIDDSDRSPDISGNSSGAERDGSECSSSSDSIIIEEI